MGASWPATQKEFTDEKDVAEVIEHMTVVTDPVAPLLQCCLDLGEVSSSYDHTDGHTDVPSLAISVAGVQRWCEERLPQRTHSVGWQCTRLLSLAGVESEVAIVALVPTSPCAEHAVSLYLKLSPSPQLILLRCHVVTYYQIILK